jgi:tRNA (adenine22-N1)-methyltransferase
MVEEGTDRSHRRLVALAAMVPPGSCVADVGTDAARLPRMLLRAGLARHCIATDVVGTGLELAEKLCGPELTEGRLELRRGTGLAALRRRDGVDVVVVAGLGAHKIVRILGDDGARSLSVGRLVLQPQTDPVLVRRWLLDHEYAIVLETMVRERGNDYVILGTEPRKDARDAWCGPLAIDDLLEAGPRLIRSADPLVRDHWERERRRLERIVSPRLDGSATDETLERLELANRVLACLPVGGYE